MSADGLSQEFRDIEAAERDIVHAVELASKVVQELSKIGGADQGVIDSLSKQFLDIVKRVQDVLVPATKRLEQIIPDERNRYREHAEEYVEELKLDVVERHLQDLRSILDGPGAGQNGSAGADQMQED